MKLGSIQKSHVEQIGNHLFNNENSNLRKHILPDNEYYVYIPSGYQLISSDDGMQIFVKSGNNSKVATSLIWIVDRNIQFPNGLNSENKEQMYRSIEESLLQFASDAASGITIIHSNRYYKPFGVYISCKIFLNDQILEEQECILHSFRCFVDGYDLNVYFFDPELNYQESEEHFFTIIQDIINGKKRINNDQSVKKVRIRESGAVNVRSAPSADSKRIGIAKAGGTYSYISTAQNGWYRIRLEDGTEGYVSNKVSALLQ